MKEPILFYDGECGFCQNSVQFILKHEKQPVFKFAALQGEFAKRHLPQAITKDLNSLVILQDQHIYTSSDAVLKVAEKLSFPYSLAKIGKFIPRAWRNWMYKYVAKNRYKLSAMSKSCKIPLPEERMRFIK